MEQNTPSIYELIKMVREKVYANKYITNPDRDTIIAAKEIARKYKVSYQSILSNMRPSGTINTQVWDLEGKIVPYKKIFGNR